MRGPVRVGVALFALAVAGCAGAPVEGMLPATWRPPSGEPRTVPFSFVSEGEDNGHGEMFTTLGPGGAEFRGPFVRIRDSTEGHLVTLVFDGWSGPEWELWGHDDEGDWFPEAASYSEFAHFYTGMVVASLRAADGRAMRCQLRLDEPDRGVLEGGSGRCQISDGGRIALTF